MRTIGPVLTVILAILAFWYTACAPMNIREVLTQAERDGATVTPPSAIERAETGRFALLFDNLGNAGAAWRSERSRLPAPHQVLVELWDSTVGEEVWGRRGIVRSCELSAGYAAFVATCRFSPRSLIYHAGLTLWATVLGFVIGAGIGVALAIAVVHSRTMELAAMPLAIVSQTIPIVAIAPMVVVVLYSISVEGALPKAMISAYLSFFPVLVGMVKGLRAPDAMQLDLLRTYGTSRAAVLWKLRLPASVPYLFASLKIGIAASLVGAIVGELPVQRGGLGARMLSGSYHGQTAQIWAALFATAALAGLLVWLVGWAEWRTLRRMGQKA